MFSLISKITRRLTRFPVAVLLFGTIFAILSAFPIMNLRWDLQLQDTLSFSDESNNDYKRIESDFGGLGSLIVVLHSKDSLQNYTTAKSLAQMLRKDPLVHFVDFETDTDYYTRHCLLYIDESDLDSTINRIRPIRDKFISRNNPFYVDLDAGLDSSTEKEIEFRVNDLQEKYARIMNRSHSNPDGTIRVVEIYPTHPLTDLKASRELLSQTSTYLSAIIQGGDVQSYFTGKVFETIRRGRTLLPEAQLAGGLTALIILLLFVVNFYRQPQLIFISSVATALPIVYTLALASLLYGRINLYTLLLAIILPGQACQIVNHVYKRYFEERARNLSPQLCIESAILGIGPSTCASSCIMASLFACMMFVPLPGLQELAILGSLGTLINWMVTLLVATALLRVFQKSRPFSVNSFKINPSSHKVTLLPHRLNVVLIAIVSIISLVCLVYGGSNLKFFYDFSKTEIKKTTGTADSLLAQTGFPQYDPIIVETTSAEASTELYRNFEQLKKKGAIPNVQKMYTLAKTVPHASVSREQKLDTLEAFAKGIDVKDLDEKQKKAYDFMAEALSNRKVDDEDLPDNVKVKFSDKNGNNSVFSFIFHNIDPDDGLACRRLNENLDKIRGPEKEGILMTGEPVIRATVLDLILKNLDKTLWIGSFLVWFFLLMFYNRFSRAIFTLLPSVFAISWLLILIRLLGIELSFYSSLAFPLIIGASVDGSLQLWSAFYTKQAGTAITVLQTKFFGILLSQAASFIASFSLIISSHPGLRSIGQALLLGLACIALAQFTTFPLIAGILDNYRIWKKKKESK